MIYLEDPFGHERENWSEEIGFPWISLFFGSKQGPRLSS
jgi:hypothetical protein